MSGRTFYLAASSQRPLDARLAIRDIEALGWTMLVDWTAALASPESEYPRLAEEDLRAARDADLFVYTSKPAKAGDKTPDSFGAFGELCVRLSHGRRAHVVGEVDHFFMRHALVIHHATWQGFLDAAAREVRSV